MKQKLISALLALTVLLTLVPTAALASEGLVTPVLKSPINVQNPDIVAISYPQGDPDFPDPEFVDPETGAAVSGTYTYIFAVGSMQQTTKAEIMAALNALYLDDYHSRYELYSILFYPTDSTRYSRAQVDIQIYPTEGATSKRNLSSDACWPTLAGYTSYFVYTGEEIRPEVEVIYSSNVRETLVEGQDYTLTYSNNVEIGTAAIQITGQGRYVGTREIEFEITPRYVDVPAGPGSVVYDGQEHTAVPAAADYTISGTNTAKAVGSYTVTLSLTDPAHTVWQKNGEVLEGDQSVTWSITGKNVQVDRSVQLENKAGNQYVVKLADLFEAGDDPAGFTFGQAEVSGANTPEANGPAYVTAELKDGVLTLTATGVDNNPYEDYDMCQVSVQAGAKDGSVTYQFRFFVDSRGGDTSDKLTPELKLIASSTALTGGGTVTLAVTGIPNGSSVNLSYNGSAPIVQNADGTCSVTLPNQNATYTFTAFYGGNDVYTSATATCTVKVTFRDGGSGDTGTDGQPEDSGTTVETGADGTVTETVTNPDGSTKVTQTKPDGSTRVTITDKDGNVRSTTTASDGSTTYDAVLSDGTNATVTEDKDGKLEARAELSSWYVSAADGGVVTVPITEISAGSDAERAPVISVVVPDGVVDIRLEIPVADASVGTVAVLVRPDGTEEVIKTTLRSENGITVVVDGDVTLKILDNSKSFDDVPASYWGAEAIAFAASRELFSGTGAGAFSPETTMSRAMIVTVLARFDGADTASAGGTWYDAGRQWAMERGISDGANMDAALTREQLVTMLWRYVGSPAASGGLSGYADSASVSEFAVEAMSWAVAQGLISGADGNALAPQGEASRAQVATIMMRFCQSALG